MGPQRLARPVPARRAADSAAREDPAAARHPGLRRPDPLAVRLRGHRLCLRRRRIRRARQRLHGIAAGADPCPPIAGRQSQGAHVVMGRIRRPHGRRLLLRLGLQPGRPARRRNHQRQRRPGPRGPARARPPGLPGRQRPFSAHEQCLLRDLLTRLAASSHGDCADAAGSCI